MIPGEFMFEARGNFVSIDIDTTGGDLARDSVIAIAAGVPKNGQVLVWSSWVRSGLEPEDEAERALCRAEGAQVETITPQLRQLAKVSRGLVAYSPHAYTARFLGSWPWNVAGPWLDVAVRFREVLPGLVAPSLTSKAKAYNIAYPVGVDSRAECARNTAMVMKLWLALDAVYREVG